MKSFLKGDIIFLKHTKADHTGKLTPINEPLLVIEPKCPKVSIIYAPPIQDKSPWFLSCNRSTSPERIAVNYCNARKAKEKYFAQMTLTEKRHCYATFLKTGNLDTFEGFCKTMHRAAFDITSGVPTEIWTPLKKEEI
jgi:hypothetical protein